jgi:acyl carrier protein
VERSAVLELVRGHAVELLGLAPGQLTEQAALVDDLGVDSLALVEFVMTVEDELGISLAEDEVALPLRLGAFVDLVTQKAQAPSRG